MKRTKQDAEITKDYIIKTALKTFSRKGYSGTTLVDIAKEANLTRGAIYWHFKDKAELYTEIINNYIMLEKRLIEQRFHSNDTAFNKLEGIIGDFFSELINDEDFRAIEQISRFKIEHNDEIIESKKIWMNFIDYATNVVIELLEQGKKTGEFSKNIPSEITAIALFSYIMGIEITWLENTDRFSLKDFQKELINIFFNSIRK